MYNLEMAPKDVYPEITRSAFPETRFLQSGLAGHAIEASTFNKGIEIHDYYLHLVASYGIKWNVEKCGRDSLQNFFDANGGTLNDVEIAMSQETPDDNQTPVYRLDISGQQTFSFKELLHIGATTKTTDGLTAGGFGEGAKMLSLSLLRDHDVDQIIFRSADWQLGFRLDDVPEHLTDREQQGLHAKVATGLPHFEGSTMTILSNNPQVLSGIASTKRLFRSSENPDFQDMTIETVLLNGASFGIKIHDPIESGGKKSLSHGRLYIAGQRRHFTHPTSEENDTDSWSTVPGMTISYGKDVKSGDRDRGTVPYYILDGFIKAAVGQLPEEDLEKFIRSAEPLYELIGDNTELNSITSYFVANALAKRMTLDFDPKYIAVKTSSAEDKKLVKQLIQEAGCVVCPSYFASIGMKDDSEFVKKLHEHRELTPSPEQQIRIDLLKDAVDALNSGFPTVKYLSFKSVRLYNRTREKSPANGTFTGDKVWLAAEVLNSSDFNDALATVLHENDHVSGGDETADFSYALTHTISQLLNAIIKSPALHTKFADLSQKWQESQERESTVRPITNFKWSQQNPWVHRGSVHNKLSGIKPFWTG